MKRNYAGRGLCLTRKLKAAVGWFRCFQCFLKNQCSTLIGYYTFWSSQQYLMALPPAPPGGTQTDEYRFAFPMHGCFKPQPSSTASESCSALPLSTRGKPTPPTTTTGPADAGFVHHEAHLLICSRSVLCCSAGM